MKQAVALLRTEAVAKRASIMFVFLVAWICGTQAGKGMSPDQWLSAAASLAGALLVALLVPGPAEAFGRRRPPAA